jgi:hypothetical protein
MKMKTKSRSKSRVRSQRRRTFKKGGMMRGKSFINNVLGKGLNKLDKAYQMAEAAAKGMTPKSRASEFKPATLSAQFGFSSPLRTEMHSHSSRDSAYNAAIHKTPTIRPPNDHPHLGTRVRHRETDDERRRRLGLDPRPHRLGLDPRPHRLGLDPRPHPHPDDDVVNKVLF